MEDEGGSVGRADEDSRNAFPVLLLFISSSTTCCMVIPGGS